MEPSYYKALKGDHAGQIGRMVGRFVDASYNDITLQFEDGEKRHYYFPTEVTKVEED